MRLPHYTPGLLRLYRTSQDKEKVAAREPGAQWGHSQGLRSTRMKYLRRNEPDVGVPTSNVRQASGAQRIKTS